MPVRTLDREARLPRRIPDGGALSRRPAPTTVLSVSSVFDLG